MAVLAKTLTGGCLCGAVRFRAAPSNHDFAVCHCSMCRRWAAGPYFAITCKDSFKIDDASSVGIYRSSEWAGRGFCQKCGTALFYRLVGKDHFEVSAEVFDDRSDFALTTQIFIDEKPDYYDFDNVTKNMTGTEVFAEFASPQAKG